jgi:ABC-type branched-subunit amino acid transport system ATPase component
VSAPIVRVRDLRHRYGDLVALDGVDFDVAEGEVFGLLGPNGGGKTTLFRVLSTLLPVAPGHVEIEQRRASQGGHGATISPDGRRGRKAVSIPEIRVLCRLRIPRLRSHQEPRQAPRRQPFARAGAR